MNTTQSHQGESVIQIHNLTKVFGDFKAVDTISLEVKKGEIFGFLGANGAGKTTAMKILCGLSLPSSGSGCVAGFDLYTQSEQIKRNIGYMSQKFALYDDLKVWENIYLFGRIYGMSRTEIFDKMDRVLENLDFLDKKDWLTEKLPLGWKQKLAFCVANFHSPKVIFLDEPTGGVDPITRRKFWELIHEVASKGTSIFVTTHYMDEVEYCHRISIMVDGKIKALDTPENLKKQYSVQDMESVFFTLASQATRDE